LPEQEHGSLKMESRNPPETSDPRDAGPAFEPEGDGKQGVEQLKDLKAEILSIDWEITDKVMTRFIGEVERLKVKYHGDKIFLAFLQLLRSLGGYVREKKGKAHPDAIRLLNSVYSSLEKVMRLKDAPQMERKRILFAEIKRFNKLKKEIIAGKKSKSPSPALPPAQHHPREPESDKNHRTTDTASRHMVRPEGPSQEKGMQQDLEANQLFLAAIEEIKDYITGELNALRAELRKWMEESLNQRTTER